MTTHRDDSALMLDHLYSLGFMPDADGRFFDLPIGQRVDFPDRPRSIVRVELAGVTEIEINVLTGVGVGLWKLRSDGAPFTVNATMIDLAIARAATE